MSKTTEVAPGDVVRYSKPFQPSATIRIVGVHRSARHTLLLSGYPSKSDGTLESGPMRFVGLSDNDTYEVLS